MSLQTVLIVEDEEAQRTALHRALELRGFRVYSAGDVRTALDLADQQDEPFAVVVLDMNLNDPDGLTGAHLGLRLRAKWPEWSPEFLILSAFPTREYYGLAMKLGVATFLEKQSDREDQRRVLRHVRALALRRALSVERPDALKRIEDLARSSLNRDEAARRFCRRLLYNELTESLGVPFLLLWTGSTGSYGFVHRLPLPEGRQPDYETVQALTQGGASGPSQPLVLKAEWVRELGILNVADGFQRLCEGAFIPLFKEKDFSLSLGLFPETESGRDRGEDPKALASVLAEHFRPAVLRHLLTLNTKLAELHSSRLAVLTVTSSLCLFVGQEQITALDTALDAGEIPHEGPYLERLRLMSEDLRDAGEVFGELVRHERGLRSEYDRVPLASPQSRIRLAAVAYQAWKGLSWLYGQHELLDLKGNCTVSGREEYLQIAIARLLQWFLQRLPETPDAKTPAIYVLCEETFEGPRVVFEDRSPKISGRLRKRLFDPFSDTASLPFSARAGLKGPGLYLPLYMAKVLVEQGNGGALEDETDPNDEAGHRFVMRFPAVPASGEKPQLH